MEALTHLKVFREDELDQKRRGDANHTVTTGANGNASDDTLEGNASDDALEGNAGDLRGLLWVGTAARHEEREVHVRQGGTLTLALISFHFLF